MQGPAYAVLSAMTAAVAPVVTRQVLGTLNPETFSILWSLCSFIIASTYTLSNGGVKRFRPLGRCWIYVLAIGVLTAAAVLTFSKAISLADPSLVSFFTRLEAVFTVLLGLLLFKERLGRLALLGTTATISGALIMIHGAGDVVVVAFILGLITALCVSIQTVLAKIALQYLEPPVLVAASRLVACWLTFLYTMAFGLLQSPASTTLLVTIVGALFGPFVGIWFLYKALAVAEVSRVATLRASFPFFVTLYSALLFGTIPTLRQMVGGGIVVVGVTLTLFGGQRSG